MNRDTKFIHFYAPCRGDVRPMSCVCLRADRDSKGNLTGVGVGISRCHPKKDTPNRMAGRSYSFARASGALKCRTTKRNVTKNNEMTDQIILTYIPSGATLPNNDSIISNNLNGLGEDAIERINSALSFAWENGHF